MFEAEAARSKPSPDLTVGTKALAPSEEGKKKLGRCMWPGARSAGALVFQP